MEPENNQNQPDLNLPKPAAAPAAGPVPPVVPGAANNQLPVNSVAPGAGAAASSSQNIPDAAEDSDLIEKEWVDKAKEIVEKNRNDPHALNKEINQMKAEYIKKRYNKDIKLKNE